MRRGKGRRCQTSSGENDSQNVERIIRKIRVDELPQLLDILTGCPVVGPRPEPEVAWVQKELPSSHFKAPGKGRTPRLRPVTYKGNKYDAYDKLQMDLMYPNPSFMEDLRICFAQ